MMGRFWAMLRRPTLVRRLMMAQMLMLTVLWSLAVAYVLFEGTGEASNVSRGVLHAIISVADNLAEQPQRQEQSLRAIDEALREEFEMGQVPELAPRILVWRDGKLVYKSPACAQRHPQRRPGADGSGVHQGPGLAQPQPDRGQSRA